MTDWIVLPSPAPAAGGDGGGQPQQGFVPTIEVPTRPSDPGSYSPGAAPGAPGSELVPSLVGGPGAQKDGGPTTKWVVTPPPPGAGPPGPTPAAPAGQPMPVPPIPPQAPQQPQMVPVPVGIPQQPAPAQPRQAPPPAPGMPQITQRFMPPGMVPPELQPAQRPPQAPQQPMPLQPTIQQQGPPGGPSWGHTTGLMAAKALEGVPMMAAGILDLPQVVGGGIYNYLTAQPRIAGPIAPMPMQPPELASQQAPQQGAQQQPGPPDDSDQPFFGRMVGRGYRALGLPEPQSENEQTAAAVAEALGGTVGSMGAGALLGAAGRLPTLARTLTSARLQQLGGATGGALAGETARRGGGGPGAQFAAALLGSVGTPIALTSGRGLLSGGRAAFTSPAGIAGRQLAASSTDPRSLEARLRAGIRAGGATPQTTAMAAQDPGLAVMEKAVRGTPGGQGIRKVEADRAAVIAQTLDRLRPSTGMTMEQRGEAIRSDLTGHNEDIGRYVDQEYAKARAVGGTYDISGVQARLQAVARKFYGPGGDPTPRIFQDVAQAIGRRGGLATNEFLINVDRRLGNAANQAANRGDLTEAAALRAAREELDKIHGSPELQAAKLTRKRQGDVMGRDAYGSATVGQIMRRVNGRPQLTGEQVAQRAVANRAGVQQVLDAGNEAIIAARASGGDVGAAAARAAHARMMMREQFLENGEGAARLTGNQVTIDPATGMPVTHPEYGAAKWKAFWTKNDATARLLFDPAEHRALQRVTQQLTDDATVRSMASAQGSHTAQHAAHLMQGDPTVANIIMAASRGGAGGGAAAAHVLRELPAIIASVGGLAMGGLHEGGVLGTMAHFIGRPLMEGWMANRKAMVDAALHEAMADPQKALLLLKKGNAANFAAMLHASKASNGPLWNLVRRLVPAVSTTENAQTAYLPAVPQVAPPLARPMGQIPGVPSVR